MSKAQIDNWETKLQGAFQYPGEMPSGKEVKAEAIRILTQLRDWLPANVDVYTIDEKNIAIEVFGPPRNGLLLVCEEGGGAVCFVTVDGTPRRARYKSSALLPDGFIREGLQSVLGIRPSLDTIRKGPHSL